MLLVIIGLILILYGLFGRSLHPTSEPGATSSVMNNMKIEENRGKNATYYSEHSEKQYDKIKQDTSVSKFKIFVRKTSPLAGLIGMLLILIYIMFVL